MPLSKPFFVMATQNPVEYEGTYPLPEAQLDRFLFKLRMGYPTVAEEIRVLDLQEKSRPIEEIEPVITKDELAGFQKEAETVYVDASIKEYIVDITQQTRHHSDVYLGVSPRGSIALMKAAQAFAFLYNRDYVIPDDIQYLAPFTLPHRMILRSEAKFEGKRPETVLQEIMAKAKVPVGRSMSR